MSKVVLHSGAVEMFVEEQGSGPALLLLNGLSQTTANWRTQARALSSRFRVVSYDARGQGRTPLGSRPVGLEEQLEDIAELLDALGIERAHLCGFSHGARVALAFAAAYPERVDRLVLTSIGTNDGPLRRLIVRSWREVLRQGGVEAMAWCTLPSILGTEFVRVYGDQVEAMVRATVQRNSESGLGALLEALAGYPDPRVEAGRVLAPTLLVTSDEDLLVPVDDARALAAAFPEVHHVLVCGCGHTIPIEMPEAWRRHVLAHLL